MRKVMALLLVLVLVTGCGGNDSMVEDVVEPLNSKALADKGFPLEEPITLTAFVHTRNKVDDFENNEFTKWLEEVTNVHLEFIVSTESNADQALKLLMSTGEYPDMIFSKRMVTREQAYYGSQGALIPLNDLVDQYGVYSKEAFAAYPTIEEDYTMPDGNIYNLPQINLCYHCNATQKLWVYEPWLEVLNLSLPETTDDYKAMLMAFRDQDPNGNGLQDEIPLSGAIKGWETDVEAFLMNAFVYNSNDRNGVKSLYLDQGIVKAAYMEEGWKEGIIYLQDLRKEGLLDPNSFVQDTFSLKQIGENPEGVILGTAPGGSMALFTQIAGDSGRWKDYVAIPPLEGPGGVRTTEMTTDSGIPGVSITDKCLYPEIAFMLADLFYSEEATFRNTIGRPGIEWAYAEEGTKGINGQEALWTELIPYNSQDNNVGWSQLGPNLRSSEWRLGREATEDQYLEVLLYEETRDKYVPYYPEADVPLPLLNMTAEQSATLLAYQQSIENYVDEKLAYFILNDTDVNKEWASYIAELKALGIEEMLAVYQEAYDMKSGQSK